jgi:hypothetical protein
MVITLVFHADSDDSSGCVGLGRWRWGTPFGAAERSVYTNRDKPLAFGSDDRRVPAQAAAAAAAAAQWVKTLPTKLFN